MKEHSRLCRWIAVGLLLAGSLSVARAAGRSIGFRITGIEGECNVRLPDKEGVRPAEKEAVYPSGCRLQAGEKSVITAELLPGVDCQVVTGTVVTVKLDDQEPKARLALDEGRVTLVSATNTATDAARVETAILNVTGLCRRVTAEVRPEPDWKVVVVECAEGRVGIDGRYFQVPVLAGGQALRVMCSQDRLYLRIQAKAGRIPVSTVDERGEMKTAVLESGAVLKIVLAPAGKALAVVTALHLAADGKTIVESWKGPAKP
jgi:hypothetical protein